MDDMDGLNGENERWEFPYATHNISHAARDTGRDFITFHQSPCEN